MTDLTVSRIGACALLTFNRPAVLNAINTTLLDELEAALAEIEASDACAVILTGAGRAFCSGSDLSGHDYMGGDPKSFADVRIKKVHSLLLRLIDYRLPSIAALNGLAYGGGLELALACTFRTSAPSARLAMPEIKLGLMPSYGGTQLLPRLVGAGRALEMMLTGESLTAEEAEHIGLVNKVDPDPVAAAVTLAERLPGGRGIAQRVIRRCVAHGAHLELAAALEEERLLALEVAASDEIKDVTKRFANRKSRAD